MALHIDYDAISNGEFSTLTEAVYALLNHEGIASGMYSPRAIETAAYALSGIARKAMREKGYPEVLIGHRHATVPDGTAKTVGEYDDVATAMYQALVDVKYTDVLPFETGYML